MVFSMKLVKLIALGALSTTIIGCVTYPENYTYSPTVTMNGNAEGALPPILPNPFARNTRAKTEYYYNSSYRQQPSPLTTYIPEPPVSVDYYPADYYPQETYVFMTPY